MANWEAPNDGQRRGLQHHAAIAGDLRQWRTRALIAGVLGSVVMRRGFFIAGPTPFYRSYLWSFMFIVALTLGPLAWLMLQYVTGGAWGLVIRRSCEAATAHAASGVGDVSPGSDRDQQSLSLAARETVAADPLLKHKAPYLNVPFFLGRAAFYFAGWMFLSWWFNRWSLKEDLEGHDVVHGKMSGMAGPGLLFWGFSVTFMSLDWILSVDPMWFSTIFGMLFMVNQA